MRQIKFLRGITTIPPEALSYALQPGWFGYYYRARVGGDNSKTQMMFNWYSCRDSFQSISSYALKRSGIFFSHDHGREERVIRFLLKVERILKLREKSKFRKTNLDDALQVRVAPFWVETKIRRSLLTIMLRCGLNYDPVSDNFEQAIQMNRYAGDTMPAIKRFLRGYTVCVANRILYNTVGWHEIFSGKSVREVSRMLVRGGNRRVTAARKNTTVNR